MSVRTHSPTPILKYGRGTLLRFYRKTQRSYALGFSFCVLTDYSFHFAYWHYSIRILVLQVFQNIKFSNTDRYAKCNTLVLARNITGKIRIL